MFNVSLYLQQHQLILDKVGTLSLEELVTLLFTQMFTPLFLSEELKGRNVWKKKKEYQVSQGSTVYLKTNITQNLNKMHCICFRSGFEEWSCDSGSEETWFSPVQRGKLHEYISVQRYNSQFLDLFSIVHGSCVENL